jgi:type I restriction enzyme S subunit
MSATPVSDSLRPLSKVAKVLLGQSPDSRTYNETGKGWPFLQGNAEFGERVPTHRLYCTAPNRLCEAGDVLLSVRAPVGATNQADRNYAIGRGLAAIRFVREDQAYGWHALRHAVPQLDLLAQGSTFTAVSRKEIEELLIWFPDGEERQAIAGVLDTLERAIEQTKALLAKQQRIKTGLMHDLLTRGLDAQGRLRDPSTHTFKPSPLGPIPSEWTTVNIEDLCDDIVDCPHSTPRYESGGVPCIRTADMVPGKLLLKNVYRVSSSTYQERISRLVPRKGDIIYSREGERLGIASPVGDELVCLGQRVMLLRPKADTDSTFLTWAMNSPSFYNRMVLGQIATTSPHINVRDIKKALVVRPDPPEQLLIGEALAADDSEKAMLEDCLEKLRRLKGGLMHDLLTGLAPVAQLLANPEASISS